MNYPVLVGKGIQPPGFSPQRGSPSEKPGGCMTFPERYGTAIQPLGFCTSVRVRQLGLILMCI